jgi:uncharacterized membrane-anchored protein YjiN (DUF445 family)
MTEDIHKAASLRKMRLYATSLLLLVTSVYIIAQIFEKYFPWLTFLKAFAVAAMVGALADWFAVSALFRHPLGLKLPHTAIIPRNKDRIGESLGKFVQENFITPEAISDKIKSIDIMGLTSEWLSIPQNSERVAEEVRTFLPKVLDTLNDKDVKNFVRETAVSAVKSADLVSFAGDFFELLTSHNRHQELFDHVLILIRELFEKFKPDLQDKIKRESGIFLVLLGGDITLYNKLVAVVVRTLDEVTSDPDHQLRRKFSEEMQKFVMKLKSSTEYGEKIEEIREEVFNSPSVRSYFEKVWGEIKDSILSDLSEPESVLKEKTKDVIRRIHCKALSDVYLRERLNNWIRNALISTLISNREEISGLIAETVKKWDAATMSRKLELEVGKDLQYIRINGTVIGGLLGLLIHIVSTFF